MYSFRNILNTVPMLLLTMTGCATFGGKEKFKPISNPFQTYQASKNDVNQTMILRTKKGDRSVELEIPGDAHKMSDFVLPMSPTFRDMGKNLGQLDDSGAPASATGLDETYKNRNPSSTDREISQSFSQGNPKEELRRGDIERGLNLSLAEDQTPQDGSTSYLAGLDHIKQLYRTARFEAALMETDEMIRLFQTDSKLHEMRGTLLDRLGRRELAIKSWGQALRFDPKNESLRKFIDRKQGHSTAGGS